MLTVAQGKLKGKKIKTTPTIRSTMIQVRKSMFFVLEHILGPSGLKDLVFGDLYCGTGSVGIEAISRGAKLSILVDSNSEHIKLAKENALELGILDRIVFLQNDIRKFANYKYTADVVFMDPPYNAENQSDTLNFLVKSNFIKSGSLVLIEMHNKDQVVINNDQFSVVDIRKYGICKVLFLRVL